MSVIGSNILAGASSQGGYTIEESLRFNESQSSYLSRTPASAGNRKTWTWSGWFKRGDLGFAQTLFYASDFTGNNEAVIAFTAGDILQVYSYIGAYQLQLQSTQVFRDPSAWYHLVVSIDTTQATAANRAKVYVNGNQITAFGIATYPSQNYDTYINTTQPHAIGTDNYAGRYFDGYITEVNFIDGQALTPSDFGEYNATTGVWQPVGYTGTYGTNGFYLPMKLDNTTEGFNTVTYIGNGVGQKIGGVGFSPDFVWIKSRDSATNHQAMDSVRGVEKQLVINDINVEGSDANALTSFNSDGFTIGSRTAINTTGDSYVAWCWDAGDTTVSNTDGSITSSVRANPDYGFSVVTYTGAGSAGTVGHGLTSTPDLFVVKSRDTTGDWIVLTTLIDGSVDRLTLNSSIASSDSTTDAPTASVFNIKGSYVTNNEKYLAYCFTSIAGYSKISTYTGTGASGNAVTTGFKPAFVMVKRTDTTGSWVLLDNTRNAVNDVGEYLLANVSDAEASFSPPQIDFLSSGFELKASAGGMNASGGTYIYMAFKDTREYAFWLDDSGNNNDWQPNGGITTESTVTDTPTPYLDGGNYCVLSPIDTTTNIIADLSNGNLKFEGSASNSRTTWGTFTVNSQKWYFEVSIDFSAAAGSRVGLRGANSGICYRADGQKLENGTSTAYGATWTAGDLIGVAFDCDAQTIEFFKNNVSQGSFSYTNSVDSSNEVKAEVADGSAGNPLDGTVNFGQRPFAYTPPTGFKSLHTGNLPDSAIENGSEYFNAVTYAGTGTSTRMLTGVNLQPDFVWIKDRTAAFHHILSDSVRGSAKKLASDGTWAENNAAELDTSYGYVDTFDTDGFTLGGGSLQVNKSGNSYVAWNWKAGGAAVTNTTGSITSQVSASPTAGFSVVTYTGTGANATVGHGLGVAPSMMIVKNRASTVNWNVYHDALGATKYLLLNTTDSVITASSAFNNTAPTSSVITLGAGNSTNGSGNDLIAYCFSEVSGYSKFGSYVGNGSTDGVFVNLGFRPAFVMVKRTDAADGWQIMDTSRDTYNPTDSVLFANLSNAEDSRTVNNYDYLSNGFKLRTSNSGHNASGGTYIYMAFAENPFKNSLAR